MAHTSILRLFLERGHKLDNDIDNDVGVNTIVALLSLL